MFPSNGWPPIWFPVAFVFLWIVVIWVLGFLSGWAALGEEFRLEGDFEGKLWRWQSGRLGWSAFNNALILGANRKGLLLGVNFIFRLNHPTLFIPWNQITISRYRGWIYDETEFLLGREQRRPLRLRPRTAERLREAAGAAWPGISGEQSPSV